MPPTARLHKLVSVVVATACLLIGVACSDDAGPRASPSPSSPPAPLSLGTFVLGEQVRLPDGDTLRLYGYANEVVPSNEFSRPRNGRTFATIDVEGCYGQSPSRTGVLLNPYFFTLVLADNSTLQSGIPVKDPALTVFDERQGDCHRGFVTFEQPEGVKAVAVVYTNERTVRWTIP